MAILLPVFKKPLEAVFLIDFVIVFEADVYRLKKTCYKIITRLNFALELRIFLETQGNKLNLSEEQKFDGKT